MPDGYFALKLEGARRAGRYLCVPFGRPSEEATQAVDEIASRAGAQVVRYTEMSAREIGRNTGVAEREAQRSREREFSERFFFTGNADVTAPTFEQLARQQNWGIRRSGAFWELFSGSDEGKAVRYLMRLFREALRSRLRSVGVGTSLEDLSLLAASDQAFVVPLGSNRFDERLLEKLPRAVKVDVPGAAGWNQTVMNILDRVNT